MVSSGVGLSNSQQLTLIESLLKIDNKQGIVVPFRHNRTQRYLQLNKTNRNIVLKYRQGGVSSGVLASMFTECITIPYSTCAVISHETRSTQRLLDRVQSYYDTMDEPRPIMDANSRSEKRFSETHSSIYVGTAGARAFGRGDTIRHAHLSELSFYEDAERILNAVEDAVPITGELTIECTPNGEDNIFYDRWVKARSGRSPYKPFFFPWWWNEEYSIPADSPIALPTDRGQLTLTGEEQELIERAMLNEDQIRWRRWKIAEKGGLFWQEYPEDEVSCFITVGDPVFDIILLNNLASACYEGTHHADGWTYWQPPRANGLYVVGADSAAGAPTGSYSAAVVLDELFQVVATFEGHMEPSTFANLLKKLGNWYNGAMIAIERNFTGYAVLGSLVGGVTVGADGVNLNNYPNIYRQHDFLTGKVTNQLGWWTNDQTRQFLMTRMRERLPMCRMWDSNLVRELRSFRFIKSRPTAQTFDDLALAFMIAIAVRSVEGGSTGYRGSYNNFGW